MPTASAIVINDGQGTPAAHTFAPQLISPEKSTFVDRDADTSAGQKQLVLSFSPANASRSTNRIGVRLNMPIEQTIDGVVSVAYTARFDGSIVVPDQMTQAQRDDLGAYIQNALADAVINAYVTDLEPVY